MSVKAAFDSYCPKGEMDGRTFVKLLKETKVIDGKKYTNTDGDLLFAKVKGKSTKISMAQFEDSFAHIAAKKGVSKEDIAAQIAKATGPKANGTTQIVQGGATQFNDKSQFTGVHTRGGPTTAGTGTGRGGYADLSTLTDRDHTQVTAKTVKNGTAGGGTGGRRL